MPPVKPMLAKAVRRGARATTGCSSSRSGTGSAASCSATATRSSSARRNERPLTRYFPELVEPLPGRAARAVRGRRRDRRRRRATASTSTPCSSASTPPRRGCDRLAAGDAGLLRRVRPARARRRRPAPASRSPTAGRARAACSTATAPPRPPHARRPTTATWPQDWFTRFEGAGFDGVMAKPRRRAVPAGQAGDVEGEAPAHRRLRRRRVPRGTRTATASARCCSACSTTTARCTTSAWPAASPPAARSELVDELAPLRRERPRRPSVG